MKNLKAFNGTLEVLFTDIDDTLTDDGYLGAEAYAALWKLARAGMRIVPVTGRPAGWCEMIARQWPVDGVIGENGGFYFRRVRTPGGLTAIRRHFLVAQDQQLLNQKKLGDLGKSILKDVRGSAIASDQFTRLMDLAIDFCEDVKPLAPPEVQKIVDHFTAAGAHAKVSSIHVNGWFGDYDKLSTALEFLKREYAYTPDQAKDLCGFIGDSPNDEPMFAFFPSSFGVANVKKFRDRLQNPPTYVTDQSGGMGFAECAEHLLAQSEKTQT